MYQSSAYVETPLAAQYLYKLCKHFARKIPVTCDAETGLVEFPYGQCRLIASAASLRFELQAADQSCLGRLASVIESHLQLMRKADNPALTWQPSIRLPAAQ